MIKRLFSIKFNSVTSAAVVIAAAGLLSRILGIIRDRVLASQFGAGYELDVYYAAFRIPDLLINLIALGALSAGFIPVFIALLKNEESLKYRANKIAWDFVSNILNIVAVLLIVLGGILAIASPWLVPLITPGFEGEKLEITIQLTQIMFLSPLLLGISSILGGVLQSFKRFFSFSLAPVMYNIGIIIGALYFVDIWGLYGLAWGVILGAVLHLLIQLPVVLSLGWRFKFKFNFVDSNFRKVIRLIGPRILGLASGQINFIVITILASTITAGSLAIFNLANNLQSFPVGFFGISYALAVFPALSKSFAARDEEEFKKSFLTTLKQILLFIVPFTALFIILRVQIVRIILGAGKFDWQDTILTADSLGIFSLSLFAQALMPLIVRAFYARHNTMLPFLASFLSMIINIVASWYLILHFDVLGLAMGFAISSIVNLILLVVFLKLQIKDIWQNGLLMAALKITFASLVMGFVTQMVKTWVGLIVDMNTFFGVFAQGVTAGFVGLMTFILIAYMLKSEELLVFMSALKRKLFRRFKAEKESIIEEDLQ